MKNLSSSRRLSFLKRYWERICAIVFACSCFWLLYYIYVEKLRRWDYLGFPLGNVSGTTLSICFLIAIAPAFFTPTDIKRFSTFITWCIYFFVYIPVVLYPILQELRPDVLDLCFAVGISFSLIIWIPRIKASQVKVRISRATFKCTFAALYIILVVYSFAIFGSSLSFSDITDVYGQRSLAGELSVGNLAGYATGWLSGCFNPLLMAIGLRHKNRLCLAIGIAGQLFVYATFAMKSILLSIVIILAMYWLVLRREKIKFHGIAIFALVSLIAPLVFGLMTTAEDSVLYENISAIVFMRTYGMVGAITGTYYDFFSQNLHTLYSHINVVSTFVSYPYAVSVGEVIGQSMNLDMNANANFFATDGIAAAGLLGVVLIGAFIGFTLRWFDSLIPAVNLRVACAAAMPNIINLSNASFFTTLLTGGLFLLVLMCSAWRGPAELRAQPISAEKARWNPRFFSRSRRSASPVL